MTMLYRPAGRITGITLPDVEHSRLAEAATRTVIRGLIVPWREIIDVDRRFHEWFVRGSVDTSARPTLALGHIPQGGVRVGQATWLDDQPDGLYGTFQLDDAKEPRMARYLREHSTHAMSIGFTQPIDGCTVWPGDLRLDQVRRDHVDIHEVALVPKGAYPRAQITSIDQKTNHELAQDVLDKFPELSPAGTTK